MGARNDRPGGRRETPLLLNAIAMQTGSEPRRPRPNPYRIDATGTPRGIFVENNPGPISFQLLLLVPSGTPGLSVLNSPGPINAPSAG